MSFEVKIEVFEGPFDLLLQLISRQELDIHEVPVAQITAAFLEHIEGSPELDLEAATEFLVIASTLLLIKARSLLPSGGEETDVAQESETAREFLIERLIEYKKFANAADRLADIYAVEGWYMPRLRELEDDYASLYPDPFEGVEAESLGDALVALLLERARDNVDTTHIAPIKISVAEKIELVRERLRSSGKTTFSELCADCASKLDLIATFLALLELYKRGELAFTQRRLFGEIHIRKAEGEESSVA